MGGCGRTGALTCDRRYFTPVTEGNGVQKEAVTEDVEEDTAQKNEQEDTAVTSEEKDSGKPTTDVPSVSTMIAPASETLAREEPKTPANKKDDEEATPSTTDTLPDLPDVPTKEPALPGEPEVKKLKLSQ